MQQFYTPTYVNEHIVALKSISGEFVYLVTGRDRALLIDTCVGAGNLRAQVEKLTNLPVDVAITHGHIDHAMGAPEWEHCWMNPADSELYKSMCDVEERMGYVRGNAGHKIAAPWEDTFLPATPDYTFLPLTDGHVFDLGGITAEAISFPGHTPGCMAMLLVEDRILVTGDACNNSTFLFDEYTSSVETYRETVTKAAERLAGRYDRVFIQHHEMEVAPDILANMVEVCDRILTGDVDDLLFNFRGIKARMALEHDGRFHRLDGKSGNIIYNPAHLRDA